MHGGNVGRPAGGQRAAAHWKQPERSLPLRRRTKETVLLVSRSSEERRYLPPPRIGNTETPLLPCRCAEQAVFLLQSAAIRRSRTSRSRDKKASVPVSPAPQRKSDISRRRALETSERPFFRVAEQINRFPALRGDKKKQNPLPLRVKEANGFPRGSKKKRSSRRAPSRRSLPSFPHAALPRKAGPSPAIAPGVRRSSPSPKLPIPHQLIKEDMQQCRHGLKNSRRTSC